MINVPEVLLLYRVHERQISTATLVRQQQLGQRIRRRYWKYTFEAMELDQEWIDPVLKISEPSLSNIGNMDLVDYALTELLRHSHGEAQESIMDHIIRLYFRVAADCPDIISRWNRLIKEFSVRSAFATKAKLWILSSLRIRPDSGLFSLLRKLHITLIRNL